MNEASHRESIHLRTSEVLNDSRAILKDADNVLRQSQVLGDQAGALVEELRQLRNEARMLREMRNKRRNGQSVPPSGTPAVRSLTDQLSATQLLMEPLPGVVTLQFVRCGKDGCHCQTGSKHGPYFYRVWRDSSGVHKKYVMRRRLEEVEARCALHLAYQQELKRLVKERDAIWHKMTRQSKRLA